MPRQLPHDWRVTKRSIVTPPSQEGLLQLAGGIVQQLRIYKNSARIYLVVHSAYHCNREIAAIRNVY